MFLRGIATLLLMTCFANVTLAQNTFNGKMIDAAGRQPISNARIMVDSAVTIVTDENGLFSFRSLSDKITITTSAIDYKPVEAVLMANVFNLIKANKGVTDLKEVTLLATANASKFSSLSTIDLSLNPVKSSQELLRLAPGLFVAQHAGGGKAEQIFLRGFDVDHGTDVSVNVDNMPVNMVSHAHGQGYADAHFIIPETVNNIDFGAGPYYTNYGNFTTAGYINLSTFNSISNSRIQVEAGRFNTYRALAIIDLLKKNKDKTTAYLAADYNYTNGPTENKQHFNRLNVFGKLTHHFSERSQVVASMSAFKSTWDASGQIPQRAVDMGIISRFGSLDPTEGGQTERYNANIIYRTRLSQSLSWENQLYYSRYLFNLYSNFTFFDTDPVRGDGIQQTEVRDMVGLSSKLISKKNAGEWTLKTTYAVGLRDDATDNSGLFNQAKRVVFDTLKLGDINETNTYAYIQEQISNDKWAFDAGVRFDHFNDRYTDHLLNNIKLKRQESTFSPKINVQYTINKNVQVYLKAGKGFHSNDTRVVVSSTSRDVLPSAYGSDLGIILKPNDRIILNIAAWYLYLGQEFVYVGDAGVIEPSGKTRREGVDFTARVQFSKHLFANVNLNYTKARAIGEAKGENFIPLAPDLTSLGGLYYKALSGFNGGINYRYIKNRPANEDNSIEAKGYFILDAVFNYTRPKYEIGFAFENLLNTKWNEAQFATTSRLQNEAASVTELHYTPGTPFFAKVKFAILF